MSIKIFMNGQLVDQENAKVSVFDHGFLYGDGLFEGIRVYNGKIFRCKQHIDRPVSYTHLTLPTICSV